MLAGSFVKKSTWKLLQIELINSLISQRKNQENTSWTYANKGVWKRRYNVLAGHKRQRQAAFVVDRKLACTRSLIRDL